MSDDVSENSPGPFFLRRENKKHQRAIHESHGCHPTSAHILGPVGDIPRSVSTSKLSEFPLEFTPPVELEPQKIMELKPSTYFYETI